jgi:hypothetical protein
MLRTNLATRPFYNQRAVHLAIGIVAILVLALTVFNVARVITLSARHTELSARADQNEERARALGQQAATAQSGVDNRELEGIAEAAREANAIIDQRTFSWTEVFNRIETTLPPDVMVTSVRPDVRDGVINVSIVVVGQRVEDIDTFMERLEATGAFADLLSRQEEATDDGMYRSVLVGRYVRAPRAEGVAQAAR